MELELLVNWKAANDLFHFSFLVKSPDKLLSSLLSLTLTQALAFQEVLHFLSIRSLSEQLSELLFLLLSVIFDISASPAPCSCSLMTFFFPPHSKTFRKSSLKVTEYIGIGKHEASHST